VKLTDVPAAGAWKITTNELVPTPPPRNCPIGHTTALADVVVEQPRLIEEMNGAVCGEVEETDVEPSRRTLFSVFVLLLTISPHLRTPRLGDERRASSDGRV
jgi:hypothetical protein